MPAASVTAGENDQRTAPTAPGLGMLVGARVPPVVLTTEKPSGRESSILLIVRSWVSVLEIVSV